MWREGRLSRCTADRMANVIYLAGRDQPAGILLVERDPLVRIAAAAHLRQAGLLVIEAIDGGEALKLLRAGRTILLVLGELDGSLIAALQREFPTVKLLLGCARDAVLVLRSGVATVGRPYDLQKVETAVKTLLTNPLRPN